MEGRPYARHGYRLLANAELEAALETEGFARVSAKRRDHAVATVGFRPTHGA